MTFASNFSTVVMIKSKIKINKKPVKSLASCVISPDVA